MDIQLEDDHWWMMLDSKVLSSNRPNNRNWKKLVNELMVRFRNFGQKQFYLLQIIYPLKYKYKFSDLCQIINSYLSYQMLFFSIFIFSIIFILIYSTEIGAIFFSGKYFYQACHKY